MFIKDIKNITLEDAKNIFENMNISFIIHDGKLKGLSK